MEDREFELEQNKFTFEKAKHIDDMRFQTFGTLYRQLFAFNIGILTLIFFVIYQSLEYNLSHWLHFFLMLAIAFSTVSIGILITRTAVITGKNLQLLTEEVFNDKSTRSEYQSNRKLYIKNGIWSYYSCLASWIIVIFVIFIAIFTVDFTKQKDDKINKTEIFNKSMALSPNATSFDQRANKNDNKSLPPKSNFEKLSEQKPQKPQPESTIKQPSNKQ